MTEPLGEEVPFMKFQVGDEEFVGTPENTSLFLHWGGKTAINGIEYDSRRFDHVFHRMDKKIGGQTVGLYLFREKFGDNFSEAVNYMMQAGFTCHINLQQVAEVDSDAYLSMLETQAQNEADDISDFVPDDWMQI